MPPLLVTILEALQVLAEAEPEIVALVESALKIAKTGVVSDADEQTIRAQLDVVAHLIDEA